MNITTVKWYDEKPRGQRHFYTRGEWSTGLSVVIRIGRFSYQTPQDAWPGLGTLPRYEVPGDLQVKYVKSQ